MPRCEIVPFNNTLVCLVGPDTLLCVLILLHLSSLYHFPCVLAAKIQSMPSEFADLSFYF